MSDGRVAATWSRRHSSTGTSTAASAPRFDTDRPVGFMALPAIVLTAAAAVLAMIPLTRSVFGGLTPAAAMRRQGVMAGRIRCEGRGA